MGHICWSTFYICLYCSRHLMHMCDPFWENLPKGDFFKLLFFVVSTCSMMYEEEAIQVLLCVD